MKQYRRIFAIVFLSVAWMGTQTLIAQEGTALLMQGVNYTTNQSAASRAAGGVSIGLKDNPSLMFLNPAMLTTLSRIQVSVGGYYQNLYQVQDQRYGTLQGHPQAVFLLQGITDQLADPDLSGLKRRATQEDSIQRPFDTYKPYWTREKDESLPLQLFVAAPVRIANKKVTIGVGAVEYANLGWYYCNNNSLSPNFLDVATYGTIRTQNLPRTDTIATTNSPYPVQWNRYYQYRNGSIYGYGGAIAVELSERLSLGLSGMILDGSTTDEEVQVGRGRMLFFYSSIRLDKLGMTTWQKRGKSNYSGYEFAFSGTYTTKYLTVGFSLKPPTTITREFTYSYSRDSVTATSVLNSKVDSLHNVSSGTISGKDKMELPLRGTVGISLVVRENLTVMGEYELAPYASATYIATNGAKTHPWLSISMFKLGVEYGATPWLKIRGGVREGAEVFQPATNPLRGEYVKYPIYSVGCGVKAFGATVNVAYEYADRRYTDTWSNSASINHQYTHAVVAEVVYTLPFLKWK